MISTSSSVRSTDSAVLPKSRRRKGIPATIGTEDSESVFFSWIMPPMTMVRPLVMVMVVSSILWLMTGVSEALVMVFLIASETVCLISSAIRSRLVTCGVISRMMPVSS